MSDKDSSATDFGSDLPSDTAGDVIAKMCNEDTHMVHLCQWLRDYGIDREMTPERLAESYALERAATVIETLHWRAKSAEAREEALIKKLADISLASFPIYTISPPAVKPEE